MLFSCRDWPKTEERVKRSIHSIYGLLINVHLETRAYFFPSASSLQVFAGSAHVNVHLIVSILIGGVSVSIFCVKRLRALSPFSTVQVPLFPTVMYVIIVSLKSEKDSETYAHQAPPFAPPHEKFSHPPSISSPQADSKECKAIKLG